jgi:hypothetical protein
MHVAATNIILWIRTLVKETLSEIGEIEEEQIKSQRRMALRHPVGSFFNGDQWFDSRFILAARN